MPEIKNDYFFIHIPRTGGTSLTKYFGYTNLGSLRETHNKNKIAEAHLTVQELVDYNLVTLKDLRKKYLFSIVRNPWDKFVSAYSSNLSYRKGSFEETIDIVEEWVARAKELKKKERKVHPSPLLGLTINQAI